MASGPLPRTALGVFSSGLCPRVRPFDSPLQRPNACCPPRAVVHCVQNGAPERMNLGIGARLFRSLDRLESTQPSHAISSSADAQCRPRCATSGGDGLQVRVQGDSPRICVSPHTYRLHAKRIGSMQGNMDDARKSYASLSTRGLELQCLSAFGKLVSITACFRPLTWDREAPALHPRRSRVWAARLRGDYSSHRLKEVKHAPVHFFAGSCGYSRLLVWELRRRDALQRATHS